MKNTSITLELLHNEKNNLILNKIIVLMVALFLFSSKSYAQNITTDTVKDYGKYRNYINLSKDIMMEITKGNGTMMVQHEKSLSYKNIKNFKENVLWANGLLKYNKPYITDIILDDINFGVYRKKELIISYWIAKSGCSDKDFFDKIAITFYDVSKLETNFNLDFIDCKSEEAVKKAIMDIPVPKTN